MKSVKQFLTAIVLGLLPLFTIAQQPFITTWKTNNPGTSCSSCITIPTTGGGYNYEVDWNNDGTFDQSGLTGDVTHDFGTAGTYTIRIRGNFPRIYFGSHGDNEKIVSIDQWGDIAWTSMERAFSGARNLTYNATDAPDLSNVTDMRAMFSFAVLFNGDLSNWDVSNVTDMNDMFASASSFNGDLSNWDVSNVENMVSMFSNASSFNGDVSSWDVSNVTDMRFMFNGAASFNGDLSNWDVSNVTKMFAMFFNASLFNGDLSNWDISNVTTMQLMLNNSGMDLFNYDETLIGWATQNVQSGVHLSAEGLEYCLGEAARSTLINTHGWGIFSDSKNCAFYNEPPMAVCKNLIVDADVECQAEVAAEDFDNGSSDPNADVLTFSVNPTGPYSIGTTNVILTVEDIYGTTSQCSATVTVEDNTPPNPVCLESTIYLDGVSSVFLQEMDVWDALASTDNCGAVSFVSLSPNQVDCNQAGSAVPVMVTVEDENGNSTSCTATITVEDNTPPDPVCLESTIYLDGVSFVFLQETDVWDELASTDNCGAVAFVSLSPNQVDCNQAGSAVPVMVTVEDENGNSASCTATITVEDNTPPDPVCLESTIYLDGVSSVFLQETDVWDALASTDNCGAVSFVSMSPNQVDCNQAESAVFVTVMVEDENGNSASCTAIITVEDNTPPIPVCLHPVITFNGEASITLLETDVLDALASTDNCGEVFFVSMSPDQVDCTQLGTIIPVTVTVEDGSGNTAPCTSNVTISGLPCDISSTPDGINCGNGSQAGYDPMIDAFTLSADDCYDPNYYSNSDSHAYLGGQLCGDGEIIAQVTGVIGNGFAGVAMREDLSAGSKMLQLGIDGGNLTKRELRASTGAPAYNHLFQTQGRHWLKLTRSGNIFTAQHSLNGTNWSTVISTTIMMGSCIEVGLYAENNTDGGSMTATFENVEIKTPTSLSAPHAGSIDIASNLAPEIRVYPNPASDEAWLDLGNDWESVTQITVYSRLGQLIKRIPGQTIERALVMLPVQEWQPGLYFIEVQKKGAVVTTPLVRQD